MIRDRWPALSFVLWFCTVPVPAGADSQTLTSVPDKPLAAEFALPDLDGKVHRLSDYRGKVVIVNFWATWCPPCRYEMPSLQRAWEMLQDQDVMLLAINVGQTEEQVWSFDAGTALTFPVLLDSDGRVSDLWPVIGLPTTFIIDPRGRIIYRAVGDRGWDDPALLAPIRGLFDSTGAL